MQEEVFRRMNASGVSCSLLTGQRIVTDPSAQHLSCTVEMADTAKYVTLLLRGPRSTPPYLILLCIL